MNILENDKQLKTLKVQLSLQELKRFLYKHKVKLSLKELYLELYGTSEVEKVEFIANVVFFRIYGNLYRLTKKNKEQCEKFFMNLNINTKVPTKTIIKLYCQYVEYVNPQKQYIGKNLFSNFHYHVMIDLLTNYNQIERALRVASTNESWVMFNRKSNAYVNTACMQKMISFAVQLQIQPISILKWTEIIMLFCKESKITITKFIKYIEFSRFSTYMHDNDLISTYYAMLED